MVCSTDWLYWNETLLIRSKRRGGGAGRWTLRSLDMLCLRLLSARNLSHLWPTRQASWAGDVGVELSFVTQTLEAWKGRNPGKSRASGGRGAGDGRSCIFRRRFNSGNCVLAGKAGRVGPGAQMILWREGLAATQGPPLGVQTWGEGEAHIWCFYFHCR